MIGSTKESVTTIMSSCLHCEYLHQGKYIYPSYLKPPPFFESFCRHPDIIKHFGSGLGLPDRKIGRSLEEIKNPESTITPSWCPVNKPVSEWPTVMKRRNITENGDMR
jgi:hypothetical protein